MLRYLTSTVIVDIYVTRPVSQPWYRQAHDIPRYVVAVKDTVRRRKYREYPRYRIAGTIRQEWVPIDRHVAQGDFTFYLQTECKWIYGRRQTVKSLAVKQINILVI